jgi:hypothetical protein
MKVRCEIVLDMETGDYELCFHNATHPGERMDYVQVREALRRVIEDVAKRPKEPPAP